jgi:hypothetical protein
LGNREQRKNQNAAVGLNVFKVLLILAKWNDSRLK